MAEKQPQPDILLIAQVRAYLLNGETIDLLPFRHENDVRAEVKKFIEDWAKSGFLLQSGFFYPWNQVRQVEVTSVQQLTQAQAQPFLDDWSEDFQRQQAFWKTRQAKDEDKEKEDAG